MDWGRKNLKNKGHRDLFFVGEKAAVDPLKVPVVRLKAIKGSSRVRSLAKSMAPGLEVSYLGMQFRTYIGMQ
jgi:hypothetical protein